MNRLFARLGTLALAVPLALGAGPAQASPPLVSVTVPGCWGAGDDSTIVCNLTVSMYQPTVTPGVFYVRVCAGDCHDVPVQNVTVGPETDVCYAYTDGGGSPRSGCVLDKQANFSLQPVIDMLRCDPGNDAFCTYV